jgi:hypothetical protein
MTEAPEGASDATGDPSASASASASASDAEGAFETLPGTVDEPRTPALAAKRQRVVGDSQVRGWLGGVLMAIFAITVFAGLGTAIFGSHNAYSQVVDVLRDLFPAELGLLGSAIGFYFGSR